MRIEKDLEHHSLCFGEEARAERRYCRVHRLIYFECVTAEVGTQGDYDVVNGTAPIWEVSGDCPKCARESRQRRAHDAWQRAQEKTHDANTRIAV